MLKLLYRKYVPEHIKDFFWNLFLNKFLYTKRNFKMILKSKLIFIFRFILPKTERNRLFAFMGKNGFSAYPFKKSINYNKLKISCLFDQKEQMYYVVHNGNRLYFTSQYSKYTIKNLYLDLITEQDVNSSHRYVKSYEELEGKILLDIGAAEGIFALDIIEKVKHVYLFECDSAWVNALRATFAPWKDKITIVLKYVSNKTTESSITMDDFMKDKSIDNLFIKMDIEGYERYALEGAKNIIRNAPNLYCSICTYHYEEDAELIKEIFQKNNLNYSFTDGYFFISNQFRKAIIRGYRNQENTP